MERKPLIISSMIVAVLIVLSSFFFGNSPQAGSTAEASMLGNLPAETSGKPAFTLVDLAGKKVSLSDYENKVVLVNFWATWCPPCVREIPDLVKLRETYKGRGFEVLGIVISSKEPKIRQMASEFGMTYPVLLGDPQIQNLMDQFGQINTIPRSFIIDQSGEVVDDINGMRDYSYFEKAILKHLSNGS